MAKAGTVNCPLVITQQAVDKNGLTLVTAAITIQNSSKGSDSYRPTPNQPRPLYGAELPV